MSICLFSHENKTFIWFVSADKNQLTKNFNVNIFNFSRTTECYFDQQHSSPKLVSLDGMSLILRQTEFHLIFSHLVFLCRLVFLPGDATSEKVSIF